MDTLHFDGQELDVHHIITALKHGLTLSPEVYARIAHNRTQLENLIAQPGARYYGVNTGFGNLHHIDVSPSDLEKLQVNLIRSHACGTGPAAPPHIVRIMMILKIISLSQGYSGIRPEIVRRLTDMLRLGIIPVVPMLGSLGASGDLAPLAHMCLPLLGEGEVVYKREQMPSSRALTLAGLDPLTLEAKEGLALINGTQYSLAWLVYALNHATELMEIADMCVAMSIDGFDANDAFLDEQIHLIRKQEGQIHSARVIRRWLDGSEILTQKKSHLQDPYSFRCAPQVHGASRDIVAYALRIAGREINAVTDNPLVIEDESGTRILSGGNFHAQPLALASDMLTMALAEIGSISERRSYLLLNGQRGLPMALAKNPGLESGMMICQYTAAALVNRNKILSHPASTDSIISSAGQEDHVSMAANAAMKLGEVVNHTWKLLGIEFLLAAQALDYRRPLRTSAHLEEVHHSFRSMVTPLETDRVLSTDMDTAENFLRQISIVH